MNYNEKLNKLEKQNKILLGVAITLLSSFLGLLFSTQILGYTISYLVPLMLITIVPCMFCVNRGYYLENQIRVIKQQNQKAQQQETENVIEQYYRDFKNSL